MATGKTEMASTPGVTAHHEEAINRIHEDRLDPHIRDDHGDPHKAALEDLDARRVTKSTWAAVGFLGFTFQPSLTFTILCCFPILVGSSKLFDGIS